MTVGIFDLHEALVQAAELERSEVDVPETVIDFLEANLFAGTGDGDVEPVTAPANAAVGADVADFEAVGRWRIAGCPRNQNP